MICPDCGEDKPRIKNSNSYRKRCGQCEYKLRKTKCSYCPKRQRRYNLKAFYGLTEEPEMKECRICKATEKLRIDHDHSTGKFRGILCDHCNKMLGFAKDNPETLMGGVQYLEGSL